MALKSIRPFCFVFKASLKKSQGVCFYFYKKYRNGELISGCGEEGGCGHKAVAPGHLWGDGTVLCLDFPGHWYLHELTCAMK